MEPAATMLETACFNAPSAMLAATAGADRIELCADYAAGGITPSLSTLDSIRDHLGQARNGASVAKLENGNKRIPIHIMIRPRSGGFAYSTAELDEMKCSISAFKASHSVDGFVFGILTAEREVDEASNRKLVEAARPLPCTFHRAVDQVRDLDAAIETIIGCGFTSILTSGGARSAWEGRERVAELQRKYGERIAFILGGGIRSTNVLELKNETGVEWIHSAAITGSDEEVDEEEVRKMVELLQHA